MSVYVNLRSTECKDIYPKNHGGNFTAELNEPLRLYDGWEVALAEMTYHAQPFPNIPREYSTVQVSLKEQLKVYNTRNLDFSIFTWVKQKGEWVKSDHYSIPTRTAFPSTSSLPRINYSWEDFKTAMTNVTKYSDPNELLVTNLKFTFDDDKLHCTFESTARACITFSKDLVDFLSLSVPEVYQNPYRMIETQSISYKKPKLPCEHYIIWPDDITEELWVSIEGEKIEIPKTSNTIEKLKSTFENLKSSKYRSVSFSFEYEETKVEYRVLIIFVCPSYCKDVVYSPALLKIMGGEMTNKKVHHMEVNASHTAFIKKLPPTPIAFETTTTNLAYNFYPDSKSIVAALNELIGATSRILNSTKIDADMFSLDNTGVCTFTEHPKFSVAISPYLLKLLHLRNTQMTHTASGLCVMPAAVREFLYIHSDILSTHSYNGGSNVLRVINNDRAANDKVMITFTNLYYYPISTRFLSNIQIRITDNHTDEDLPFTREVTCLLHFRRCNNPRFS
jgi:hypothetical protein